MASFLDRAKEQAQRGLQQGKDKYEEFQAQRAGNELLQKLGAAYYRKEQGDGSEAEVERAKKAVDDYIDQHGDELLK